MSSQKNPLAIALAFAPMNHLASYSKQKKWYIRNRILWAELHPARFVANCKKNGGGWFTGPLYGLNNRRRQTAIPAPAINRLAKVAAVARSDPVAFIAFLWICFWEDYRGCFPTGNHSIRLGSLCFYLPTSLPPGSQ